MKSLICSVLMFSSVAMAVDYGYLKAEDQKYYKNDQMEGQNKQERLDSVVKEINKLYGELETLKADVASMKKQMEELKSKK